jgi:CRP-like cAMP-binding protein
MDAGVEGNRGNKLLDAFPATVRNRLNARVRSVTSRQVLDNYNHSADVYFPHAGTAISLIRETAEGPQIEVGLIGPEGFANFQALLTSESSSTTAIVQTSGEVSCVSALRLRAEFAAEFGTRALLLSYTSICVEQLLQSVICNAVHSIEQRLSRWLLVVRDRIGGDDVRVSHDSLAKVLGIQRSGVTLAIGVLTEDGLIDHSRKRISVCNADGLSNRACECWILMMKKLDGYRAQLRSGTGGPPGR